MYNTRIFSRRPVRKMAGRRQNIRRARPPTRPRRPQLASVLNAMARLNIARPRQSTRRAPNQRRRRTPANPSIGSSGGSTSQRGHEFLNTVVVPAGATIGQNLYQLEVNPTQFPQLSVFASQYTQWKGTVKLHVESLGNAFATSAVSAAYVADPDGSDLPVNATDLLRVVESVEAVSRTSIHLQDCITHNLSAPWRVSTNPWKFVVDTDLSDRANGLFLIVALGDPGTTAINLKVSVSYAVTFQGRKYAPLETAVASASSAALGINNGIGSNAYTNPGGSVNWAYNPVTFLLTFTFPIGQVSPKYFGTWSYGVGTTWFANAVVISPSVVTIVNRPVVNTIVVTATTASYQFAAALAVPPVATTSYTWNIRPRLAAS